MKPILSASANNLRNQINKKFPNRDKKSDGWIGDTRHQAEKSDHNPDPLTGYVRAIDVDDDGIPAYNLAVELVELAKANKDGGTLSYVIWDKKIASKGKGWVWRKYDGADPHTNHIHISFLPAGDKVKFNYKLTTLATK
jgi:hypothetical protein